MKFSENWLRKLVNPPLDTQGLTHQMTMAGLEVEAVEVLSPAFDRVVIGRVEKLRPHPDADKLKLTQVNVGDALLDIVCGASNVAEAATVAVARVGARLPNGVEIKQAKVRGEISNGMLCSEKELGLAEESSGLMLLAEDAPLGMPLGDYLQLHDHLIEVSLTPNRGDCLSILGLARDLAVLNQLEVKQPPAKSVYALVEDTINIDLRDGAACPRYCGRVVREVDLSRPTPVWLSECLRRAGQRSVNAVVDITNYVMLELGQPMHAFDLSKLSGGIQVRMANDGESLTLLNGETAELAADTLVIADEAKALAIAGVMGGMDSSVTAATTDIFFESAFFHPAAVAGKARQYGLHTESSHRFERGVDFNLARRAIERATSLLLDITGGKPGPVAEAVAADLLPTRPPIRLRGQRLQRMLGLTPKTNEVVNALKGLGMEVKNGTGEWWVTPPSYRFDIAIEADLIEEVARIYGYDRIAPQPPSGALSIRPHSEARTGKRQLSQILVNRGYHEAITYSFIDPAWQRLFSPEDDAIALTNPISADMALMRTSLWPGLVQAASRNLARQQQRIRLFETGSRYFKRAGGGSREEAVIAGIAVGAKLPEQWSVKPIEHDFFDIKGDVEALLGAVDARFTADRHNALHPGRCARIVGANDETIGWLGVLHPELQQKLDIMPATLFELRLDAISQRHVTRFQPVSRFPSIRRDIALVVDRHISAGSLLECARHAAGAWLQHIQLFDVYQGEAIDSGRKSIAMGLTLQDFSRTLTDAEIDGVIADVVTALQNNFGASLRV